MALELSPRQISTLERLVGRDFVPLRFRRMRVRYACAKGNARWYWRQFLMGD